MSMRTEAKMCALPGDNRSRTSSVQTVPLPAKEGRESVKIST